MKELKVKAYAKINLFLEICGKRENGYHEIDTVMQTVGLYDGITVSYDEQGQGITLSCNKKHIPTDKSNIAYKCAALFLEETGKTGGVHIHIDKKIPVAAGLGGGSADGAAVLKALNRLTGAELSLEELCVMGTKIGADIPFCIRGGCARATGIGEIFEDAPDLCGFVPVIAMGRQGSSTPAAYGALDAVGYEGKTDALPILRALEEKDAVGLVERMYNAFESVILPVNPEAAEIKNKFVKLGASGTMMSGSGAAVFGLFESPSKARFACNALRLCGKFAVVAPAIKDAALKEQRIQKN